MRAAQKEAKSARRLLTFGRQCRSAGRPETRNLKQSVSSVPDQDKPKTTSRAAQVAAVLARVQTANEAIPDKVRARFSARFDPRHVPAEAFFAPDQVYHGVHIPKTGGMSFGKALAENMTFHPVPWYDTQGGFADMDAQARAAARSDGGPQVVMGHYGWGELIAPIKEGRVVMALSFVRDPVARLVSHFDYNRSTAHPNFEAFRAENPSFEDFVAGQALNPQIKQLIGRRPTFDLLLTGLATHYSFLGVSEHFAAGLAHLGQSHGLSEMTEYKKNAAERRFYAGRTEVSADLTARIYRAHFEDLRLHRLISSFYA